MKKTIGLIILLVSAVIGILGLESGKDKVFLIDGENAPVAVEVRYEMGKVVLEPWYDGETGVWYVFFPSFLDSKVIDCGNLKTEEFYIDGKKENHRFEWQDNTVYEIVYNENTMQMIFLEDKNLSTIFIETESGNNEFIRAAKENVEDGYLVSLDSVGKMEYGGKVSISGHGNAWEYYDKRAYDIKLKNKASLAGIDGGSHWKLLHLSNDGDKIHSKLAYDIAELLGAEYTPQCNWVNVYLNGEYYGMYLLATAVRDQEVFKSDNVVLLEKDLSGRYELEEHVITEDGNPFVIHRPRVVDEKRKEEIWNLVQTVENSITEGKLDESLIDVDSFVTQFLVDEITLNSDGFETSAYVYQITKNSPMCAGPAWDYDAAFGEALHMDVNLANPAGAVLDGEMTELTWYQKLYDNPEFVELVSAKYESAMPGLRELYEETIDMYITYIEGSVRNDYARWKGNFKTSPRTGNYQSWENNLRFLKYFYANRFNVLKDKWNIEGEELVWEGNGENHTVRLLYGGTSEEIQVMDGATFELETSKNINPEDGWQAAVEYSEEGYSKYLPVLEDYAIKLERVPGAGETENGKYVEFPLDMFVQRYDYVSVFTVDAEGNMENILSAEPFTEDIYLEFGKEETGMAVMYVFSDETASVVLEEVVIEY